MADSLSERDWAILRLLAGHRYLATRQIEAFCFHDHASAVSGARSARRVLRRLADLCLIRPTERRIGGVRAGSSGFIWQMAPAGARLLSGRTNHRTHEPSPRFLHHCLAVADAHLAVLRLQRDGAFAQVEVELEPDCWRAYSGLGGERRLLQPDLYVRTVSTRFEDRWFIEVDLGTESLPTLLGKCRQYQAYRASGHEQSAAGVFPLVIWQMSTAERRNQLAHGLSRSPTLTPELFRVVTCEGLSALLAGGAV